MTYLNLRNDLALRMIDWGLPAWAIRSFVAAAELRFKDKDPSDLPSSRTQGMNATIVVADPDNADKIYSFYVRVARNDNDHWISDISCVGLEGNKIFWSSEGEFLQDFDR